MSKTHRVTPAKVNSDSQADEFFSLTPTQVSAGIIKGLLLNVGADNKKTWIFRAKVNNIDFNSKLGDISEMTLNEAEIKALDIHNGAVTPSINSPCTNNHVQQVLNDESLIPDSYLQMIEWGSENSGKLSHAAKNGEIRSIKILHTEGQRRGKTFLNKEDVKAFFEAEKNNTPKNETNEINESAQQQLNRIEQKLDAVLDSFGIKL